MNKLLLDNPSLSVIIPCYNHGRFLQEAIDSVYAQAYPDVEIVVVDDGSTDNTRDIVGNNPQVKYLYQSNQGPSSARNNGVRNSTGDLLVFLDADDWLLPGAIDTALQHLKEKPESAFVSGGYRLVFTRSNTTEDVARKITEDHYIHFLKMNFVGMHATVMYQRWVFSEFEFSTTQRASEDYDMYLRITRKYPICHHDKIVAAYRIHSANTSSDIPKMLAGVLTVLEKQKKMLMTPSEEKAYVSGRRDWIRYYCNEIVNKRHAENKISSTEFLTLLKHSPRLALSCILPKN